jgi:hypothetical protein
VENQKPVSHFPARGPRRRTGLTSPARQSPKGDITRAHLATLALSDFQAHRPLETKAAFRLILCWKQNQSSGSFLDWKMPILLRRKELGVVEGGQGLRRPLAPAEALRRYRRVFSLYTEFSVCYL